MERRIDRIVTTVLLGPKACSTFAAITVRSLVRIVMPWSRISCYRARLLWLLTAPRLNWAPLWGYRSQSSFVVQSLWRPASREDTLHSESSGLLSYFRPRRCSAVSAACRLRLGSPCWFRSFPSEKTDRCWVNRRLRKKCNGLAVIDVRSATWVAITCQVRTLFAVPNGVYEVKFVNFVTYFGHIDLSAALSQVK